MTGLLALLIFSELTNVVIDRPFSGPVKVGPEAKNDVLTGFAHSTGAARVPKEHR
jgi:hypothetical protein